MPHDIPDDPAAAKSAVAGVRAEVLVASVMLAISALFVGVRLHLHDYDASVFMLAGELETDPVKNPDLFVVGDAMGYDGQRYYRLARNPFSSSVEEFGITFNRPAYWQQRIGYPFLTWIASGFGQREAVPWALIAVNVAAVSVIAGLAARMARMYGRSPWLGLVPAAWGGYVVAIAYDLTEPVVGAFLLGALLALQRRRWGPATLCLVGAALTRETSLIFAGALLATAVSPTVRRWSARRTAAGDAVSDHRVPLWVPLLPIVVYAGWRTFIRARWSGAIEGGPESDALLGAPLEAFLRFVGDVVADPAGTDLVNLAQLFLTVTAMVILAWSLVDRSAGEPHERLALATLLFLFACLPVWHRGQAYLRWACEPVMIGWLIALGARASRARVLGVVVALLWLVTAVDLAEFPGLEIDVNRSDAAIPAGGGAPGR